MEGRANVFLTATLDERGKATAVRIRNISRRGALVDAPLLPPVGTRVRLMRGRLTAAGQLAWAGAGQAGLNFDCEIDVASWVQRAGNVEQQRVDGVLAALRSGRPPPAQLQESQRAASLEAISAALDQVCDRLAQTQRIPAEFGEQLVELDALAQALRELATGRSYRAAD